MSNTPIQREEYFRVHTQNVDNGEPQIQKYQTHEAAKKLSAARSYTLTADDLNRMVREKREKGQVKTNSTLERGRLQRERDELLARGETERAAEYVTSLSALDGTNECMHARVVHWVVGTYTRHA